MLFDFTEAERNTTRRALEIYVSELIDEIGKNRETRVAGIAAPGKADPRGVIEQLSV